MDDMAPHAAIVRLAWEIHERRADGRLDGHSKAQGSKVIELRGADLALCRARVNQLQALIVKEIKPDEPTVFHDGDPAGPVPPLVPGAGGAQPQPPAMLKVRGGFAGRGGGRP